MLKAADFDYHLPSRLIAQNPLSRRDHSNLMVLDRQTKSITHQKFSHLGQLLGPNDVLVLNQTKVFPARLYGQKSTGGRVELLLISQISSKIWQAISRPGLKPDQTITFNSSLAAKVLDFDPSSGLSRLKFNLSFNKFWQAINSIGHTPLPPYINSNQTEQILRQKYQTVYASQIGSAAAPTAGLHFTQPLLKSLSQKGVQIELLTLHVGLGTFQPLRPHHLKTKKLHSEYINISRKTAKNLNSAKQLGKRIIAVGTTTTRALETATSKQGLLYPYSGQTTIFLYPPYQFRFVDSLITNFHLPQSSLLMLVSALTSSPNTPEVFSNFPHSFLGQAYQTAVKNHYRFFSFGDAMWII